MVRSLTFGITNINIWDNYVWNLSEIGFATKTE